MKKGAPSPAIQYIIPDVNSRKISIVVTIHMDIVWTNKDDGQTSCCRTGSANLNIVVSTSPTMVMEEKGTCARGKNETPTVFPTLSHSPTNHNDAPKTTKQACGIANLRTTYQRSGNDEPSHLIQVTLRSTAGTAGTFPTFLKPSKIAKTISNDLSFVIFP